MNDYFEQGYQDVLTKLGLELPKAPGTQSKSLTTAMGNSPNVKKTPSPMANIGKGGPGGLKATPSGNYTTGRGGITPGPGAKGPRPAPPAPPLRGRRPIFKSSF